MIRPDTTAFSPPIRSLTEMDRNQIVRDTIDEIERRLNAMGVNKTYQMAFNIVFRVMREMKPEKLTNLEATNRNKSVPYADGRSSHAQPDPSANIEGSLDVRS